ncbi:unnamed protein product [Caenorhabditis nigoni]
MNTPTSSSRASGSNGAPQLPTTLFRNSGVSRHPRGNGVQRKPPHGQQLTMPRQQQQRKALSPSSQSEDESRGRISSPFSGLPKRDRRRDPDPDFWIRIPGSRFEILDSGFRIRDSGFLSPDSWVRFPGSRFRTKESGIRIPDSRFGIRDSGFRILKSGFLGPVSGFEIPDSRIRNPDSGFEIRNSGFWIPDS